MTPTTQPPTSWPPPPDPRALLRDAGFFAKKSWGQNFLLDEGVLADVARLSGAGPGQLVVELGAGLGALTYHLLRAGGRVLAIERDRDIVPLLRRALAWAEQLEIRESDAGRLDYAALAREYQTPLAVAGNLPYQLSGRILVELANAVPDVTRAVLMVQREVAERLTAAPGTRAFGLLSVLVGRSFEASVGRAVPPSAFLPPPKVHSSVVVLRARAERLPPAVDRALVRTARAAFHSRRKTLKNSLSVALQAPAARLDEVIRAAAIDPGVRAETLDLERLVELARQLEAADLLPRQAGPASDDEGDV